MLSPDPSLFDVCTEILCREYGPVDYQSEVLPWDNTEYYRDEMGDGIVRKFIFFERLTHPNDVPRIKIFTSSVETEFAVQSGSTLRRRINLDPGYVTEAKVVLTTSKDFSHRVYIGEGIYAEVTLRYSNAERRFLPFDYTYPDYRTDAYTTLFKNARDSLRSALKKIGQDI
jgi:hypothetical protein